MILVTTAAHRRPRGELIERARQVAERLGVSYIDRTGSIEAHLTRAGAELAYVVSADNERLDDGQQSLHVKPGAASVQAAERRRPPAPEGPGTR